MGAELLSLWEETATVALAPAPERPPARLPPLYYLRNFRLAIQSLSDRYAELLNAEESGFIDSFRALDEGAQCLLTRLAMRKGPVFRRSTLNYAEIPDIGAALHTLTQHGLVDSDPLVTSTDLFHLLDRAQLRRVFGAATRAAATVPEGQLALPLSCETLSARPVSNWHPTLRDEFLQLTAEPLIRRLQWLFFGNDHQDWHTFVLTDLGLFRYESVLMEGRSRAFQRREEIAHYYRLNELRARLREGESGVTLNATAVPPTEGCAWLIARFMRLQLKMGERLEEEGEPERALATYRAANSTESLLKAVRLQERLGQHEAARRDALVAKARHATEAQLESIDRILIRLQRRLDQVVVPHRLRSREQTFELALPECADLRVERAVAQALSSAESPAYYVENGLLTSLFGLLCWEAVFDPVPGAFFHAFQAAPADLHTDEFRLRRAALFESALQALDNGQHEAIIWHHYHAKANVQNPFVRWGRLKPTLLKLALHCIPARDLKLCFERLLNNLRDNTSGLPDLIQFWPEERRYRLIEVKAPGDRLQYNQRRWMRFFAEHAIPSVVCQVCWQDF